MISEAHLRGTVSGFKSSRFGPIITHLFFADDSLLFSEATSGNCVAIRKILDDYARASGQAINFAKSTMCVSSSVNRREKERLAAILGVGVVGCHEVYLGLPCYIGRNKMALFTNIVNRV